MKQAAFDASIPLGLYIHTPWCVRKCPYCDFNSHETARPPDYDAYVDGLIADLEFELPLVEGRELGSVFIGGGTPSLFPPQAIGRLLKGVRERMPCHSEMEVTMEANPGTLEADRYPGYREGGVNRLSVGVQSFTASALQQLGRIHGVEQAVTAIENARQAGFDNLNLDLMFGLPGQSRKQALSDVALALELGPTHLSYYQLTLEPNTAFHHAPPVMPSDDNVWEIQQQGHGLIESAGYHRYEISAYALPGRECRHNLNYWQFGDYLGIGAGAHGKLTDTRINRVVRRHRVRSPGRYLSGAGGAGALAGETRLTQADLSIEFMMNALRLSGGFSKDLFRGRTGLSGAEIEKGIWKGMEKGFIALDGATVRPTPLGYRFLDDLLVLFTGY
ncbi:MAG: radical SAM family heme chaperone HemW [Gammaproteobacteria bacterium]|nr:radical SAM family heme chaperone HemW [Gammaproteobacteria bacterium]